MDKSIVYIFASAILQRVSSMPRSKGILFVSDFDSFWKDELPLLLIEFEKKGFNGTKPKHGTIDFVAGEKPPRYFVMPYQPLNNYERAISFYFGSTCTIMDPTMVDSVIGHNFDWLITQGDVSNDVIYKTIMPVMRGNRNYFMDTALHHSIAILPPFNYKPIDGTYPPFSRGHQKELLGLTNPPSENVIGYYREKLKKE